MTNPRLTTLGDGWDYQNDHVQNEIQAGSFVSGKSTLLMAGPAKLGELSGSALGSALGSDVKLAGTALDKLYPIGLAQQFGFNQALPSQEVHEIGSERSYFMKARTSYSATIGTVFYNGPNILRSLYAYSPFALRNGGGNPNDFQPILKDFATGYQNFPTLANKDFGELPGYGNIWLNGKSDLFSYPFGLAVLFADTSGKLVTAIYIEDAYIQGHNMSIGATSTIIMESCTIRFDRIKPIKMEIKFGTDTAGSSTGSIGYTTK